MVYATHMRRSELTGSEHIAILRVPAYQLAQLEPTQTSRIQNASVLCRIEFGKRASGEGAVHFTERDGGGVWGAASR
jgi:hypothetical protein